MSTYFSQAEEPAKALEAELGLPAGFLDRLLNEDDWSFVIKIHALVEAAATHALVAHTGFEAARDFFSRLELSAARTGKLALSEALGLLQSGERRFVRSLSELRNLFVHDVRNVDVDLDSYFSALSKDKRKHFAKSFCYVDFDSPDEEVSEAKALEMLSARPKHAIWNSALVIVAILQLQAETANYNREIERYRKQISAPKQ